ncbi:MAG TPA: hypothetical protein VF698_03535 [Thermoanaerobaculia bacterium]
MRITAVMLMLFTGVASALGATTSVALRFSIAPGHQYDEFGSAEAQLIRAAVERDVSTLLQSEFPIFDFAGRPAEHTLDVIVIDDEAGLGVAAPVVLKLRMDVQQMPDDPAFVVLFRKDADRDEPLGGQKTFTRDVVRVVANALATRRQELIRSLFKWVSLTNRIELLERDRAFAVPFTAAQYSIREDSKFIVRARDAAQAMHDFDTKVAGETALRTTPPQQGLRLKPIDETRLPAPIARPLQPIALHLKEYWRQKPPTAPTAPTQLDLGGTR